MGLIYHGFNALAVETCICDPDAADGCGDAYETVIVHMSAIINKKDSLVAILCLSCFKVLRSQHL
jgi:hypothetical protein